MNCREFWENTPDGLEHLRECAICAAAYQREGGLTAGLKALAAQSRSMGAPARVERRLVKAFRAESMPLPAPTWRAMWFPIVTWGATVAATMMIAALLMRERPPQPAHRMTRSTVQLAHSDLPAGNSGELTEDYSDFIPLPNAEGIGPNDEVDVVRVEVPRSAMLALGLPVSAEQVSGKVEADIAVAADGTARAVRFLDE